MKNYQKIRRKYAGDWFEIAFLLNNEIMSLRFLSHQMIVDEGVARVKCYGL